ncbi:MAG: HAD-IC family P-type ATPase [bacterium]|nr:HAD-IC family P-type ATPase [bacterium]
MKAALGLTWGIGLLILSIVSFNIPMIAYYIITALTALITLYLGNRVYKSAWNSLLNLKWDTTTLYTISTLTIIIVSIISLFIPGLPLMFEAAPLVLGFWHLGEGIEHSLIGEITKHLDVRDCVPPFVLLKGISNHKISVKQLVPHDTIIVNKGGVIPVDGVIKQKTLLYTTRIDGSPLLKLFHPGDAVKAGMRLADHIPSLEMCVTKTYQNSYLSLIAQNIDKANKEKAPVELFANQVLKYFIPTLLVTALISGIVIGFLFSPALAIQCVISVLVSACPCALSLITPMAVKIGMKKASEQGIHFSNGKSLQAAAGINCVVFDLNGTLTKGEIRVHSLQYTNKKLLAHFALLEDQSDHPVAKIIKSYLDKHASISKKTLNISYIDKSHHSGIKGIIDDELLLIGNKDFLLKNAVTSFQAPFDNPENGSIYLVRGAEIIGQISLMDPLREDAVKTINQLKNSGKQIHICTGADNITAEKYAHLLGISKNNICANTVGASTQENEVSKTSYIEHLKDKGYKVAMVGDAANDLTAIASAHLGIAVKSSIGDKITEQHAGIVVQQGLLFPIATAFDVAKKTQQNIFQNLFVSLSYNSVITLIAAGLFIGLGLVLNPALGVAFMVIESTIVLANLYRFKQQNVISIESCSSSHINENLIGNSHAKVINTLDSQIHPSPSLHLMQDNNQNPITTKTLFSPRPVHLYETVCGTQQHDRGYAI